MTLKKILCLVAILTLTVFATVSCNLFGNGGGDDEPGTDPGAVTVKSIYIVDGTTPERCIKGEVIDTSSVKVMAVYTDNTEKELSITDVNLSVSDTSKAGTATITAKYGDFFTTKQIPVVELRGILITKIAGVNYNKNIKKLNVNVEVGATIDYSDLTLELTYSNGVDVMQEVIEYSDDAGITVNIPETTIPGSYPITVEYQGATSADDRCTLIISNSLLSLEYVEGSVSNYFTVTSKQDAATIELIATYADGSSVVVTKDDGVTVSNITTSEVGTFSYTASFGGMSVTVPYTVISDIVLTGITVKPGSFNLTYKIGDEVSALANMILSVNYSDGRSTEIAAVNAEDPAHPITVIGYDNITTAASGTFTLTIMYNDGIDDKSFNIPVTVMDYTSIRVEGIENCTIGTGNGAFNLKNIKVFAVYPDGTEIEIDADKFSVLGTVKNNVAGVYTIVVSYKNLKQTFAITVSDTYADDLDNTDNLTPEVSLG